MALQMQVQQKEVNFGSAIVFVDDNKLARKIGEKGLKKLGFTGEIKISENASTAYAEFAVLSEAWLSSDRETLPPLVITDHDMGSAKEDGSSLAAACRLYSELRADLPQPIIIGVSGNMNVNAAKFERAGVDEMFARPIRFTSGENLDRAIRAAVEVYEARVNAGRERANELVLVAGVTEQEIFDVATTVFAESESVSFKPEDLRGLLLGREAFLALMSAEAIETLAAEARTEAAASPHGSASPGRSRSASFSSANHSDTDRGSLEALSESSSSADLML